MTVFSSYIYNCSTNELFNSLWRFFLFLCKWIEALIWKQCGRYIVTWFLRHKNIKEHPEAWSDLNPPLNKKKNWCAGVNTRTGNSTSFRGWTFRLSSRAQSEEVLLLLSAEGVSMRNQLVFVSRLGVDSRNKTEFEKPGPPHIHTQTHTFLLSFIST